MDRAESEYDREERENRIAEQRAADRLDREETLADVEQREYARVVEEGLRP